MGEIDQPAVKQILWQQMRDDLTRLVPWFQSNELLLCPACCRALKFEAFSLEHIIPQQALSEDPIEVKSAVPRNERSGLTLLCQSPLYIKGQKVYPKGCNSWKGKHYDPFLREIFQSGSVHSFSRRHQIALQCAGYLGLIRQFGCQIALMPSGVLMRRQFFTPNSYLNDMPVRSQMVLAGKIIRDYDDKIKSYWSEPFKFTMHGDFIIMVVRSVSLLLPISRDPSSPLARLLSYAPPKYQLKPDLRSIFH